MLRNTESRVLFFGSMVLFSLLLAAIGSWAVSGLLGAIIVGVAVLVNAAAVLYSPFMATYFEGKEFVITISVVSVVATLFGCIAFGWWGFAYLVGAISGFLMTAAIKSN